MVVPVYNEEACLATCLVAVARRAADRSALEVVVVDGGSADASIALVKRLAQTEVPPRAGTLLPAAHDHCS